MHVLHSRRTECLEDAKNKNSIHYCNNCAGINVLCVHKSLNQRYRTYGLANPDMYQSMYQYQCILGNKVLLSTTPPHQQFN